MNECAGSNEVQPSGGRCERCGQPIGGVTVGTEGVRRAAHFDRSQAWDRLEPTIYDAYHNTSKPLLDVVAEMLAEVRQAP